MVNIKKGIDNAMSVLLILFGTIIGSKAHESLITSGEYNYEVGFTLGVAMFGVLVLTDLVLDLVKSAWFAVNPKRKDK